MGAETEEEEMSLKCLHSHYLLLLLPSLPLLLLRVSNPLLYHYY